MQPMYSATLLVACGMYSRRHPTCQEPQEGVSSLLTGWSSVGLGCSEATQHAQHVSRPRDTQCDAWQLVCC